MEVSNEKYTVAVGNRQVALTGLFLRFQRNDAALDGPQAHLLRRCRTPGEASKRKYQQREAQPGPGRGGNPCMRMTFHAEHALNENSRIA